jgi:hypothetical protein
MIITLTRKRTGEYGTFGKLYADSEFQCYTLEPPWYNNQENISCIPAGRYQIMPYRSPHFGLVYKIINVPDRTDILIHKGNTLSDTEGCLTVGSKLGTLGSNPAVLQSKIAFDNLIDTLDNKCHDLVILEDYG